ncbi:hypothetical protein AAJ76_8200010249 [Vairimorpha ceranae]|uniref:Uncharacterized protein n=1 Tax=Vairimorpha ceranae TaxID=40302 RepID=A0A0F9W9I6_9MICR|nr:hypothetical protein AAJ76_8200010249 [Vairimorpha ceranae]KKO74331.1 hypothetical protein AAJ76_8200010249 [Vairimorpha ceranae]
MFSSNYSSFNSPSGSEYKACHRNRTNKQIPPSSHKSLITEAPQLKNCLVFKRLPVFLQFYLVKVNNINS